MGTTKRTTINLDTLPESFREEYLIQILDQWRYHNSDHTRKFLEFNHFSILMHVLESRKQAIIKRCAKNNPLEFLRYRKLINDDTFCIFFNTVVDFQKSLELIEYVLAEDESLNKHKYVRLTRSQVECSKVFQTYKKKHHVQL